MIEKIREYCISKPGVTEEFPFDDTSLVFKVMGRMFLLLPLSNPEFISVKCDPEKAIELRERYFDILPAWHFNKKHWNMMRINGNIPQSLFFRLIDHSYECVVAKLPRSAKRELINTIQSNSTTQSSEHTVSQP